MSGTAEVFLGLMAVSLLVMAAIQIGLIVVGLKVAKQMTATTDELRREIRPLLEKTSRIADDAARVSALTVAQAERVDQFLANTSRRVDATLGTLQGIVSGPIRQSATAVSAFQAALSMIRLWQSGQKRKPRETEDDPLFVG